MELKELSDNLYSIIQANSNKPFLTGTQDSAIRCCLHRVMQAIYNHYGPEAIFLKDVEDYFQNLEMKRTGHILREKVTNKAIDRDITFMSVFQLQNELQSLRDEVRRHRDAKGHDRCWLNDQALYNLLPEKKQGDSKLPPLGEFLEKCVEYHKEYESGTSPNDANADSHGVRG